jgi:cytidylate kinase
MHHPDLAARWALLVAGLAIGESRLGRNADHPAIIAALRALGSQMRQDGDSSWVLSGRGIGGLVEPAAVLDVGADRWLLAVLAGLLGSHPIFAVLTGVAPFPDGLPGLLRALGARVLHPTSGGMPLAIAGARDALPLDIAVADDDLAVAALVAGLNARGITRLAFAGAELPRVIADGVATLRAFGADVSQSMEDGRRVVRLRGQPNLRGPVIVPLVIAVDGPAAAGKGTLARRLAAEFGLPYLDTGLLYRAVARLVFDAGGDPGDAQTAAEAARRLRPEDTARADLRGPPVDGAASQVGAHPAVRAALVDFQRMFAQARGGVLDGRDIGTVIFPDAPIKFFVTASAEARSRRRWLELQARGGAADLDQISAEMHVRDANDAARAIAPMQAAADAIILDTTDLDADAAFRFAAEAIRARFAGV